VRGSHTARWSTECTIGRFFVHYRPSERNEWGKRAAAATDKQLTTEAMSGALNTLAVGERRLSAPSGDRVLGALCRFLEQAAGDNITLDLSTLGFVDPYGMGLLCLAGRHLSRRFWDITCRLPQDRAAESYLSRMGVFDTLSAYVTFDRPPRRGRPNAANESLLEVTEISRQGDVEQVLCGIDARVAAILGEELGYTAREFTGFKNVVAELCHNILDHSGDRGCVVAQRYLNQKLGEKFVVIGVCDLGIGIRESLASRYDVSRWTHGQAIAKATRKAFSRDPTRGLGLYVVRQICDDFRGSLHIRSGDARVYARGKRTTVHPSAPFPGTQVSITLYERRPEASRAG